MINFLLVVMCVVYTKSVLLILMMITEENGFCVVLMVRSDKVFPFKFHQVIMVGTAEYFIHFYLFIYLVRFRLRIIVSEAVSGPGFSTCSSGQDGL